MSEGLEVSSEQAFLEEIFVDTKYSIGFNTGLGFGLKLTRKRSGYIAAG